MGPPAHSGRNRLQGTVDGACPMLSVLKRFSTGQTLKNPTVSTLEPHPDALIVESMRHNDVIDRRLENILRFRLQNTNLPYVRGQLLRIVWMAFREVQNTISQNPAGFREYSGESLHKIVIKVLPWEFSKCVGSHITTFFVTTFFVMQN